MDHQLQTCKVKKLCQAAISADRSCAWAAASNELLHRALALDGVRTICYYKWNVDKQPESGGPDTGTRISGQELGCEGVVALVMVTVRAVAPWLQQEPFNASSLRTQGPTRQNIYIYIYIHVYVSAYTYIQKCICTCMYMCMYT